MGIEPTDSRVTTGCDAPTVAPVTVCQGEGGRTGSNPGGLASPSPNATSRCPAVVAYPYVAIVTAVTAVAADAADGFDTTIQPVPSQITLKC